MRQHAIAGTPAFDQRNRMPGKNGWLKGPPPSFVSRTRDAMTDLDELRAELDEFAQPEKKGGRSPREERIIAGFEEIQRFVEQHGRVPQHGEDRDIFERLYAVRLDRLRSLEECRTLLTPYDHQGLMSKFTAEEPASNYSTDDEELLTELAGVAGQGEITQLRHVRTNAEKRAAEEIASRTTCPDFDEFKPAFEQIKRELKFGIRQTRSLQTKALEEIQPGSYFIIGGQIAYIAEIGEELATAFHSRRSESRLRVIYDNGTESNVLQRSLQRALYRDEAARLITDPDPGPLFSGSWTDEDVESGTIYVLRSLSDHPFVTEHRELIHKIGVTGGNIGTRITNDPHFCRKNGVDRSATRIPRFSTAGALRPCAVVRPEVPVLRLQLA
jgi:hypothetical protein